jgi:UDP-N-acetylglucosamine 2-epimerase (non-hydrolysing)
MPHVHIVKPIGYLDFLQLNSLSTLVLTDSGGLQEEAITLDIPALTLRYNTERPETVTAGGNILVGSDKEIILENARRILDDEDFANKMKSAKNPYGMGNAAELMIKIIEDAKANDTLKMEAPDEVMSSFTRKMKVIDGDMSVKEFEENNNSLIKIAFDGEEIKFPYDDLNLNGLTIIYEDYAN